MLQLFKNISGLNLNRSKSEILQIGVPLTSNYTLFHLKWKKERIYALGTWFYKDHQLAINQTYENRLQILKDTINTWKRRNLTWIGKITVIKSICIAKLNYAITNIETPRWFTDQTKKLIESFLWDCKPPRVKTKVMYNSYEQGGLRLTNLECYIHAQKINWIKHLLYDENTVPAQYVASFIEMEMINFLKCNIDSDDISVNIPEFYREILHAWFCLKKEPETAQEIQRTVIWKNKYIKIGNKSLFYRELYDTGLVFINDILDHNGLFISHEALVQKYGNKFTEYDFICLKDAIPKSWRKILRSSRLINIEPRNETLFFDLNNGSKPIMLLKSKQVYWFLNNKCIKAPSCIQAWSKKYNIEFSENEWKKIFCLTKSITVNTKLQEFQFKIIHRVYASSSYVSNFDKTVSKNCILCGEINNIQHFFAECVNVRTFWQELKIWLRNNEQKDISINTNNIIFGIYKESNYQANFYILHAKWYIHLQRESMRPIRLTTFLNYFKTVLIVEQQLSCNLKTNSEFRKIWGNLEI